MVICALFWVKKPQKWRISAVFCGFLFGGALKTCDFDGVACFFVGCVGGDSCWGAPILCFLCVLGTVCRFWWPNPGPLGMMGMCG